jgi:O-antigen/teichoic acid export membrane protein
VTVAEGDARRTPSVLRQFVNLSSGRTLAAVVSAVWFIVAARSLTRNQLGDLALLLALGAIFASVADGGLSLVLAEKVAGIPESAHSATVAVLWRRVTYAVVASGLLVGAYVAAAGDARLVIPILFAGSFIATAIYSTIFTSVRAGGHTGPEAANEFISRVALLCIAGLWLAHGGGLLAAVASYVVVDVGSAIVATGWFLRRIPGRRPIVPSVFRLRATIGLAAVGVVGTVYYRIDVWLLALIKIQSVVALYAAAYRLFDALLLPAASLAGLIVPIRTRVPDPDRKRAVTRRVLALGLGVTTPAVVVLAVLAAPVLGFLYGPEYRQADTILQLLLLGTIPTIVATIALPVYALAHRKAAAGLTVALLVMNVALNVALIPAIGAPGAAIATALCQLVLAAVSVRALWS